MSKHDLNCEITIDVVVTGDYTPGKDGESYTRSGDPGNAPEPSEFSICKVLLHGNDITKFLEAAGFDFNSLTTQCLMEVEENE